MTSCDTVIIGAGPYGLSIAAHLRAANIPFQIYGSALESWRSFMPEGMVLKSEPFASNLWDPQRRFTLKRYAAEKNLSYVHSGRPLSLASFLDYAEWFRRRAVGETNPARVRRVSHRDSEFTLEFAGQSPVKARRVVLATGHMTFCYVPPELENLPASQCLHSSQLRDLKAYAGRDVTVLGAGQSALESAALLYEAGAKVRVVARRRSIIWNPAPVSQPRSLLATVREPESGLGLGWQAVAIAELPQLFRRLFHAEKRHRFVAGSWGPTGAWWLKARFENRIETLLGCSIRAAQIEGGRARLQLQQPTGTCEIETDHVIAGTGFKVDVERMGYLDAALRASIKRDAQMPQLNANFETSVPDLFIVGIASAPTFGPVMRFMFGAKHVAPVLARRLKREVMARGEQALGSLSGVSK